ncbi:hypothetical protein V2J09_010737 [Rumex salicifolius]
MSTVNKVAVVGSHVWVEDPEIIWIDGEVAEIHGDEITVVCTSGKAVTVNASRIYIKDTEAPPDGVDDMTKLAYLHEPGVLENLKCRYNNNEIYTYTGGILIAVNPFQRLPHLYGNSIMEQYRGVALGEMKPHPFAIADIAYRHMINDGISQAILVSGESGAGKTETTKMLMQYLAYMGGRQVGEERTVEQQVLESNPVLEAFGNAKTVRNNNSSRFGKFVEIQFDQRGRISGAAIRTYLLERSRVCQLSDPERNYHCFYMLCAAPPEDVERFKLGDPRTFHYLNQSNCIELDVIDDAKEYLETRRAMGIVGINSDHQDAIFRVVAAILHLGNVEFAHGSEIDSSKPKDDKAQFHLKTAAELFMCDVKALENSICTRVIVTRDESFTKCLDPGAAVVSRDTLARTVYSRLFDWIVNNINTSIGQDPDSKVLIGILDIYGFESFKTNSFEQFCINLTNERLQQHFNQHVFKMEQEEYTREEIDWSYIEFVDNQDVLDMIEKKPGGIIALLDEACMFPRSTHETFAEKLYQTFNHHTRFSKPKLSRTDFTVSHYAGDVTYQTDHFLDKNKDYVIPEHQATLGASKCPFVASLFPPLREDSSKSTKFSSIGTGFKLQLQSLLETLSTTQPHYIRCVKPNNLLKPFIFENSNVLQQLRCGGVMEAIRISCAGYPTRRTFHDFLSRFRILAPKALGGSLDEVTSCKKILGKVQLQDYQIGKTKVFLRAGQMAELDALRTEILGTSATIIQRKFCTYSTRERFILLQASATHIQEFARGQIARRAYHYKREKAACIKIQKESRRYHSRKAYEQLYCSAVMVQTGMRAMAARKEYHFQKQNRAAVLIQSHWRMHVKRLHYIKMKRAAIVTQCGWRVRVARKELRKLKMAAKETGVLQAAKGKLEKEVKELNSELQLEKRLRADLEADKAQEIARLERALEEMKIKVQESNALLDNEREAVKKKMMDMPSQQKVTGLHHDVMNKLADENEQLKDLVTSLEIIVAETTKISKERLKKAQEAESKIVELKTNMKRLEEKIANMESECKSQCESKLTSSTGKMSGYLLPMENGHTNVANKEGKVPIAAKSFAAESTRKSHVERQRESVNSLIECVSENIGFSKGKPVAAFTIYKCLLHWRSFEMEKTNVFDALIHLVGSSLEKDDINHLTYWLSNTSNLLFLLERSMKTDQGEKPPQPTSFFGRLGFRSSANLPIDVVRTVEAKQPALLFKQQLLAYVETIYSILRDNVRRQLSLVLSSCIQASRTPKTNMQQSADMSAPVSHWQSIVDTLNSLLNAMRENFVPSLIVQKMFVQIFSYINAQLFNSLLQSKECCTFSNGEYVKSGLDELLSWSGKASEEYFSSTWDELKQIRQAVGFLVCNSNHVIHQKSRITYNDITSDLCPTLSIQQLYRMCTLYCDDNYNTKSVSPDVIFALKDAMKDANQASSDHEDAKSYMLIENSRIPFMENEISNSMQVSDFIGINPPAELLADSAFQFLRE